jgi:hypothetical protein
MRRYREKSSFISATATLFGAFAFLFEPRCGSCFVDDGEDLDPLFFDVIEHPHFSDTEPVLGTGEPPETLDLASTQLLGLMPEMPLDRVPYLNSHMRTQRPELPGCFWRQDDVESHSGQKIARIKCVG